MTTRSAYGRSLAVLRAMTPEERVRKAFELGEAVRDLFRAAETEVARTVPASELEDFLARRFGLSRQDLLVRVAHALDGGGIDYFVTGSLAASVYGEPRIVKDLDVKVALEQGRAADLLAVYPGPDVRYDPSVLTEVSRAGALFVGERAGDRVDFWFLRDLAFDRARFERKRDVPMFGTTLSVPSPEDSILAQLRWANEVKGSEEKCYRDALRVYEVQRPTLDTAYLEEWADRLGLAPLLERMRVEAVTA